MSEAEERKAFEAWMSEDGAWPKAIERDPRGGYMLASVSSAWSTWQAAWKAALESEKRHEA